MEINTFQSNIHLFSILTIHSTGSMYVNFTVIYKILTIHQVHPPPTSSENHMNCKIFKINNWTTTGIIPDEWKLNFQINISLNLNVNTRIKTTESHVQNKKGFSNHTIQPGLTTNVQTSSHVQNESGLSCHTIPLGGI